jgi:hypothetical protein
LACQYVRPEVAERECDRGVLGQFAADLPVIAAELDHDVDDIPYVDFQRLVSGWLLDDPAG